MDHWTEAERALVKAIGDRPYLMPTADGRVTYRAAYDARTFTASAHSWLPEYEITVNDHHVGSRKTARGALALLVKLGSDDYLATRKRA